MPTLWPTPASVSVSPKLTRNTVLLLTLVTSMSPSNGTVMRGCVEKPSSVLMTSMSWQSLTRTAQSGFGRLTRLNVACELSRTLKRSVGNGAVAGSEKSNLTLTLSASAASGTSEKAMATASRRARNASMLVS